MVRRTVSRHGSPRCAVVRHDSYVPDTRPHTRTFSDEAREVLGREIQRARETAGHPYRPSFAELAGPPLGVRTLLKLEKGKPVSAMVYEAAGRALGRLLEDWSAETPLGILRGAPPPQGVPRAGPDSGRDVTGSRERQVERYPDQEQFLRSVIEHLRKQGMPEEEILRSVEEIIAQFKDAQGTDTGTPSNGVD